MTPLWLHRVAATGVPGSVEKALEFKGRRGQMAGGFGFTRGAGVGMVSALFLARFGRGLTIWRGLDLQLRTANYGGTSGKFIGGAVGRADGGD
jgi:hypothetical protein